MDRIVQNSAQADEFSGAVLVARDGQILLDKGYGFANREWGIPNDSDTKFRLGSITKQFTAVAIMILNERGLVDLDAPVKRYIDELLQGEEGPRGKNFNMRWVASMVADVHRIMTRGGVFMYPSDKRATHRAGHLRLMYEANPMSLIVEQAGGAASTGKERILDVKPGKLHERVSVFLGSKSEVDRIAAYHAEAAK